MGPGLGPRGAILDLGEFSEYFESKRSVRIIDREGAILLQSHEASVYRVTGESAHLNIFNIRIGSKMLKTSIAEIGRVCIDDWDNGRSAYPDMDHPFASY